MSCDFNQIYPYITTALFFIYSIGCELFAYSNCNANSVGQFFIGRCGGSDWFVQRRHVETNTPLPHRPSIVINENGKIDLQDGENGGAGNSKATDGGGAAPTVASGSTSDQKGSKEGA